MEQSDYFTAEERQQILQESFEAIEWIDDFEFRKSIYRREPGFDQRLKQERIYKQRLIELRGQYMSHCPVIPLTRCPYCHHVNALSLDFYGLEGMWWSCTHAWRNPNREQICEHYWTLSGAMRLQEPVVSAPFRAQPGPEVPFVVPQALEEYPIRAVVSQVQVGEHTAYPIAYFAVGKPMQIERPFTAWSLEWAFWVQENNQRETNTSALYYQLNETADYDLAHWIKQGKLEWIAPGDESLTLQSTIDSCPYLDLPGRREVLFVTRGRVNVSRIRPSS
jgi:hypothetical protein